MFGWGDVLKPNKHGYIDVARGKYFRLGMQDANDQQWLRFFARDVKSEEETGWKFHISVKDRKGQEAIAKLAIKHGVPSFKLANDALCKRFQNPHDRQCGKSAVLYYAEKGINGPINWPLLLDEAAQIVEKYGAGPGVQRDANVPKCRGVFYRCERGAKGEKYIPRDNITNYLEANDLPDERAHNLAGVTDLMEIIGLAQTTGSIIQPVIRDAEEERDSMDDAHATMMHYKAHPPTRTLTGTNVYKIMQEAAKRDKAPDPALREKYPPPQVPMPQHKRAAAVFALLAETQRKRTIDSMPGAGSLSELQGHAVNMREYTAESCNRSPLLSSLLKLGNAQEHIPYDPGMRVMLDMLPKGKGDAYRLSFLDDKFKQVALLEYTPYSVSRYQEAGQPEQKLVKARMDLLINAGPVHRYEVRDVWHEANQDKAIASNRCYLAEVTDRNLIKIERNPLDESSAPRVKMHLPLDVLRSLTGEMTR